MSKLDIEPGQQDGTQASGQPGSAPATGESRQQPLQCERKRPNAESKQQEALPTEDIAPSTPAPPAGPVVTYSGGVLTVDPRNAQMREVLEAIRAQAGFTLDIPPAGMNEMVFGRVGPMPLREALIQLLYGSGFNYIIQTATNDPQNVKRIAVTPRIGTNPQNSVARMQTPPDTEPHSQTLYGGEGFTDTSPQEQVSSAPVTPVQAAGASANNVPGIPSGFNLQQAATEAHKTPSEILDEMQKHQLEILDAQSPPQ